MPAVHSRRFIATAAAAISVLGVAACGSDDSSSGSGGTGTGTVAAVTKDAAAANLVPADVRKKGTIVVAADASYPPNEFFAADGKTIIGLDADLAKALGEKLGLTFRLQNAGFDSILAGLQSGKYDLGMSSFTDNKEREKVVNFVTYLTAGTSFFVQSSGGPTVNGLSDLCGKTVAVEKGTVQQTDAQTQAKKCGSKTVSVKPYPDQSGANLALSSGRAQVAMADSPVADYQVKQSGGRFKLTGQSYGTAPYGIAVPKSSGDFPKALQAALKSLVADGTYQRILDKWGIEKSAAVTNPVINGATS